MASAALPDQRLTEEAHPDGRGGLFLCRLQAEAADQQRQATAELVVRRDRLGGRRGGGQLPVSDIDRSHRWYTALFGTAADNNPMPTLVEWQVISGAWVQVFDDPTRAGTGLVNFAVDDLERHLAELRGRVIDADKGVRLSAVTDPDGNVIRFIGGFRVRY